MYYTYILKSLKDNKYYYGATSNLDKRIKAHNTGKVKSTKSRRPLILHFHETFSSKKEALEREAFFKSVDGYRFLKSKKIT